MDWAGAMGVPITFLHKYNPEQFEIVGYRQICFTIIERDYRDGGTGAYKEGLTGQ
jgi:hypothetical protein